MCGRYALRLSAGDVRSQVEAQTQTSVASWDDEGDYHSERGYNIPPRTRNPVCLRGGGGHADDHDTSSGQPSELRIQNMQWGLIPHWMKRQPDYASSLKTINARDDTIMEGGSMWKSIRGRKRCIVLAEGFYEWLKKSPSDKLPHHVKRKDGQIMCFAGLWDSVTYEGEDMKPLYTYTIVTTHSSKQLNFLHDRMPVILTSPEDIATWLDTSENAWTDKLAALLKPYEEPVECYPVPKEVGKVGQQSPDFLKPVSERKGNISSFFSKQASTASPKAPHDAKDKKTRTPSPTAAEKAPAPATGPDAKGDALNDEDAASKVEKVDPDDLTLNPDDDDKIATPGDIEQAEGEGKETSKDDIVVLDTPQGNEQDEERSSSGAKTTGPESKKKPAEGKAPATGKASEPIVLDDDDDDSDEDPEIQEIEKPSAGSKRKRTESNSPVHHSKSVKTEVEQADEEGNEKLTTFFDVKNGE